MGTIAYRAASRKPLSPPDSTERRIVRVIRHRADRELEFAIHVYKGRKFFDLWAVDLLPGGERLVVHRDSWAARAYLEFLRGFQEIGAVLRDEGAL
jgi:hypothetical protein